MEYISIAFFIGLLGSFHCLGMCGPIAFALPLKSKSNLYRITASITYNTGRITTYSIFGLVFGLVGQGLKTANTQQFISVTIGVLMILSVIIPKKYTNKVALFSEAVLFINQLKKVLGKYILSSRLYAVFITGMLNGLLPCGLVYAALGGALAMSTLQENIMFMFMFGLGTFPLMLLAVYLSNFISVAIRNKIRKIVPIFLILLGAQFIVRGLNLNIPYLSPKINVEQPFIQDCK